MRLSFTSLVLTLAVVMIAGTNFAAAQSDPVLAKVNGTEIHQSDLALAETDVGEGLPPGTPDDQRRALLLQYLINVNLLSQAAEKKGTRQDRGFFAAHRFRAQEGPGAGADGAGIQERGLGRRGQKVL